ncbi:hypothetical protein Btru_008846 [Bulinus truncatus]|nr:hypothetical protein Btru_008846 [Bulinus truncatus]
MGRDLKATKLYRVIAKGRRTQILKVSREYFKLCKDPNIRDSDTGGSLLHHIVSHHEKFNNPEMMTVVYMLGLMDIDVDVQDYNGDTALHCVVRQKGAYSIMVALLRRVFQAIDDGHLENVHKLLTCKKYAAGRDDCGRTPLMKAVMKGRRIIAIKLATDCGFTINMQDSV